MKALPLNPVRLLQSPKFCLFGIAASLTVLHLLLTWRMLGDTDRLIFDVLFWGAILCLLWRKQDILYLESDVLSSFLGFLLIALVLLKSINLFALESAFLKLSPLLVALGLGLLASGFKGLKQYWQELMFVLLVCLPAEGLLSQTIEQLFKVTTLTAQFAVFFLWYLGFEISRQGADVILPHGYVFVDASCTGLGMALLLLKLSVVFILMFPTSWKSKILVPLGAVLIGFVTGGVRAALMVTVVTNQELFHYWHGSPGNQIFSTISILIFGLLCRCLIQPELVSSDDVNLP